ncbi:MAG: STAS domain-containing protein [Planctomycetota bacterium]
MKFEKHVGDDIARLTLKGEFETEHCDAFSHEVEGFVKQGFRKIILNLRLVKFINSTAIGEIVKAKNRLSDENGELVVAHPSSFVSDVFKTLGLDRALKIFETDEEAISYYRQQAETGDSVELSEENILFTFQSRDHARTLGRPFGVGKIASLTEDGVSFTWSPQPREDNSDLAEGELMQLFSKGTPLKVKFRLPLYKKNYYFEIPSEVAKTVLAKGGQVAVQADFLEISNDDRKSIARFVDDMKFIKKELDH